MAKKTEPEAKLIPDEDIQATEEAEKAEAERIAKEEAEKSEAERVAKEEAEKAEAERIAKEEAEKAEAKEKPKVFLCVEHAQVRRGEQIITVYKGNKISLISTDKYNEKCFQEVK
jgi:hypothetical protein